MTLGPRRLSLLMCLVCVVGAALLTPALAQEAPVKIGVLLPLSGEIAAFGEPLQRAAELAVSVVNEQGGLLGGRRLEVVVVDDRSDPEAAVAAARRLVHEEGVFALVTVSSPIALRVATEVTIPEQIVHITLATSPSISQLDDGGYVFRMVATDEQQAELLAVTAQRLGHERVSILHVDSEYGRDVARTFTRAYVDLGGRVAATVSYVPGKASYREELEAVALPGSQALVLVGYPESGAVIVREALEHGYFSRFVLSDGLAVPAFIQAFAGALEGAAGATPYSLQWPNYTETLRLYEERYGPVGHVPLLSEMFESVTTLALAAEMAGDTASAAVRDALESINKSLSGDEEIVWPHEWAKAVQLIREGIPFFYAGVLDPEGFNEAGDPGVVLAGAWTVIGGQIREIGAREYFLDAQPEAQDPVKIGVLIPYSGELADYGEPLQRAAVLAASHVNEQGGLLGRRRLELV